MVLTPGPGHNNGPSLEEGTSWRTHCWRQARESLLPTLPIEVVRLRITRARELGLPYRTYAGIRASTGHDVIGFLFSTNALRLLRPTDALPEDRRARLQRLVACDRMALVQPPLDPAMTLTLAPLDAAFAAPRFTDSWPGIRDRLRAILAERRHSSDGYVLIGETAQEREWSEAGRLGGYLAGDHFFARPPG
jgi:septum formation topological specificity factor MinE